MSVLREMQPSPRRMSDQEKRQIFEDAKREGRTESLTPKQMEVFKLRGYFEDTGAPLMPFRQVVLALQDPTVRTHQAAHSRETFGFKMLENGGQRKSRIKPSDREFILNNPDLPANHIAAQLGHTEYTVAKYKDQLNVPRRPVGRPGKNN